MSDEKKNPKQEPGNPSIPYGPSQLPWGKQVPKGADITAPIEDPIKDCSAFAVADCDGTEQIAFRLLPGNMIYL